MKQTKLIYWIATGLLSLMMLGSAGMYIFNYDEVSKVFTGLGFPLWIIYPLAVAKILGVVAILTKRSQALKEWAYAGFFFDFMLAFGAHIAISDGDHFPPLVATVLLFTSYFLEKRAFEA